MFPKQFTECKSPPGQVTTRHIEGSIVETVYTGYCSAALVQAVLEITPMVLESAKGTRWLLDMSGTTGVEVGARVPGLEILRKFREGGGTEFAVVIAHPPLRMLFTAVAFAALLPVKVFDTTADALRFLRAGAPPVRSSSAPAAVPACPKCKGPMTWRPQHQRHFCPACSVYL